MTMNEFDREQEAALDEALTNLPKILAKRLKLLEQREEELQKSFDRLEKEKKSLGCGNASDVIHLNVGGTLVATLRRTLTHVEDSMLAARFSGRWDESIEKDKDGNFFVDQSAGLFLPMINYIRNMQNQTPSTSPPRSPTYSDFANTHKDYDDFIRMVEYFGVTLGIYPVELVDYTADDKEHIMVTGSSSLLNATFSEWKICGIVPTGHTRRVKGFEVKIGDAVNLQIGWIEGPVGTNTDVSSHSVSVLLDVARGGISCNGHFESISASLQNGTFVRCKNYGKEWFIDGEQIVGNWSITWETGGVVPAMSGKGEWTITSVELET
ncbi:hypothetical protein FisN_21Lh244 [Fistulifera solaris]|uniref:Potassium channel tetramerisation-type BTB domain-containing protein n=1 Tax=Fistulifera solaris TaxID=1519565 RepID=A0A1Z5KEX6_FISSO|nr:hypothetical protein FisN_21Lh244 [Fistulifera solaris]|eukprot:GAX24652.1 hypothetical protein FisN_21Lh244 [Fistulifera solaris]